MSHNFVLRHHDSIASASSIVKSLTSDDLKRMLLDKNTAHHHYHHHHHHLSACCCDRPTPKITTTTTTTTRCSRGPFASNPQQHTTTSPCRCCSSSSSSHLSLQEKKRTDSLLAGFVLSSSSSGAPTSSNIMSVDPSCDGRSSSAKAVSLMLKGSMFNSSYSRAHAFSFSVPHRLSDGDSGGEQETVLLTEISSFLWERALAHFLAAFPSSSFDSTFVGERVSANWREAEEEEESTCKIERKRQRHLSFRESRDVPALQGLFITSKQQETVFTTTVDPSSPHPDLSDGFTTFTIGIITATGEESAADIALKWFSAVNNDYCLWLDELEQQQQQQQQDNCEEGGQREKDKEQHQELLLACDEASGINFNNCQYYCGTTGNNDCVGDLCVPPPPPPHLSSYSTCCDPTIIHRGTDADDGDEKYNDDANKNRDRRSTSTSHSYGLSSGTTTTSTRSARASGAVAVVVMSADEDIIVGDGNKKNARRPRESNHLSRSDSSPLHHVRTDGVTIAACSSRRKLRPSSFSLPSQHSSHSQDGGSQRTSFEPRPPSCNEHNVVDRANHSPSPTPPRLNSRAPLLAHKILRSSFLGSDKDSSRITPLFAHTHHTNSRIIISNYYYNSSLSAAAPPPRPKKLPSPFSSAATASIAAVYRGCCLSLAPPLPPPAICGVVVGGVVGGSMLMDEDDECANRLTGLERDDHSLFCSSPLHEECGGDEDEDEDECRGSLYLKKEKEEDTTTPTNRNFLLFSDACYQKTKSTPCSPHPAHPSPSISHKETDNIDPSSAHQSPEPKNSCSGSGQHALFLSSTKADKYANISHDNSFCHNYGEEAYCASDAEEGHEDLAGVEKHMYLGRQANNHVVEEDTDISSSKMEASDVVGDLFGNYCGGEETHNVVVGKFGLSLTKKKKEEQEGDGDGDPLLIAAVTQVPRRERCRAPSQQRQQQQHSFYPLLAVTDQPLLCTPDQKQVSGGSSSSYPHFNNPNLTFLIPKAKNLQQKEREMIDTVCTAAAKALPPPPPLYLRTDLELPFCTAFNFHPSSSLKRRGVSAGLTATNGAHNLIDDPPSSIKKASTYAEKSSVKLKLFWEPSSERVSTTRPIAPVHVFLTGGAKRRQEHTTTKATFADVGNAVTATSANQLFQDPVLRIVRPVASGFARYQRTSDTTTKTVMATTCVVDGSKGHSRTRVGASFVPRRVDDFTGAARAQFTSSPPCASGASNNMWSMPNNTLSHFVADDIGVDAEGEHVIAAVAEPTEDYAPFVPCLVSMLPAFLVVNDD